MGGLGTKAVFWAVPALVLQAAPPGAELTLDAAGDEPSSHLGQGEKVNGGPQPSTRFLQRMTQSLMVPCCLTATLCLTKPLSSRQ